MEIQSRPELAFDEQQHLYTLGGLVLPSVTQIMSPMSSMLYAAVPQAALDAAADRGTRAHEQVSNYVRYGVFETDEDTAPYVRAFLRFCKDYSPTWQGSEIRTYHRQMMYAGTLDLLGQSSRNAAYSKMIFTAADALFGEKAMTEICESGMTVDMLSLLVQKTFALINGVEDFDEEDGQELSDEDSRSKLPGDAAKK